jgi:hypothetical protein
MTITPEIVKAEMDYRVERAHANATRLRVRASGRAHHAWFRRHHEHPEDTHRAAVNGAPRVA